MLDEPAPHSMRSIDQASMLRVGDAPGAPVAETRGDDTTQVLEGPQSHVLEEEIDPQVERGDEADEFELSYADGTTTPHEPSKRGFGRRREPTGRSFDSAPDELASATQTDVWAAHREQLQDAAAGRKWDQAEKNRPGRRDDRSNRSSQMLALLAAVAALLVCLAIALLVLAGGGKGGASSPQVLKYGGRAPKGKTLRTTVHRGTHRTTRTSTSGARPPVRRRAKKRTGVDRPATITRPPADTTPAIISTTQVATSPVTPPVTSTPSAPTEGSRPTGGTSTTNHSGSSSHSSAGSGTVPAGALPDVKQTEQQP